MCWVWTNPVAMAGPSVSLQPGLGPVYPMGHVWVFFPRKQVPLAVADEDGEEVGEGDEDGRRAL